MNKPSFCSASRAPVFVLCVLAASLVWIAAAPSARAQGNTMPFTVEIEDNWSYIWYGNNQLITLYVIRIKNESRERITGVTFTSGGSVGFYSPCWHYSGPSGTVQSYSSGSQIIRITDMQDFTTGLTSQWRFYFAYPHTGIAGQTMFNNGTADNAIVTVYGADGGRGELVLSDTLYNDRYRKYVFQTEERPRTLTVDSLTKGSTSPNGFVSNFVVRVRTPNGTLLHEQMTPSGKVTINWLRDGDKVEIEAFDGVHLNASGQFLYDNRDIPAEQELDPNNPPRQRYVASGISVNNTPQTGDPTQYSFDMQGDTMVDIRWRHDYALLVNHDFLATASPETDAAGKPWAGPLTSGASGNPTPDTTKIHWIEKGESVIAQIDGEVIDFTHSGLNIRYVPKAYRAQGSARGVYKEFAVHTNLFTVGQAPPQRQQVDAFVMDDWGSIDYVWQIQFGIQVNMDDVARSALPRVLQWDPATNMDKEIGSLEGIFWFNPGDQVKVVSAANVGDATSLALSGWVNGDGFYFSANGDINSQNGTLLNGGPSEDGAGPVAVWMNAYTNGTGRLYRGLSISSLRRPARVVWSYGNQVYLETVRIGEYVFQNSDALLEAYPELAEAVLREPDMIQKISVSGRNQEVAESDMAIWDSQALRLYPLIPGLFRAIWQITDDTSVQVIVSALPPDHPHYPHIAGSPPVQLTPDPGGTFIFKALKYTENNASISGGSLFTADSSGRSVLLFGEIQQIGRGVPKEFLRVRMVETRAWNDSAPAAGSAIIGRTIEDAGLDLARLGTGYVKFQKARYNAGIYDGAKLDGLTARSVYDMSRLRSTAAEKVVVSRAALPGPIIPVNLHPRAGAEERIVVVWYYDPTLTDEILWPYAARTYLPRWPLNADEGLGRIVIASQYGSESLDAAGQDQVVAGAVTSTVANGTGGWTQTVIAAATTYDPSRIQQPAVYVQNDPSLPGYNPNEEHALMAPSRRFAQVSPRPPAAYALRDNDLNRYAPSSLTEAGQPQDYSSHPYVLVQYYDTAAASFAMRVYKVEKEDPYIANYYFANQGLITLPDGATAVAASPLSLVQEPHLTMDAGEPVIPFYPLGVVIGATPAPETYGVNIKAQSTYWEDHKGTSWAVSGGENAWFTYSIYYPMSPSFWWPPDEPGRVRYDETTGTKRAAIPNTGDSVAFLPGDIQSLRALALNAPVPEDVEDDSRPTKLLYKSDWPAVAPVLKAGETLTFSGGEYRQDHPTSRIVDPNGNLQTIQTPGLPAVLAFAVGEVVFDSLNPLASKLLFPKSWTVRMAQVLDTRSVPLPTGQFPSALLPASGKTRISGGKYVFNDLPASLQKRVRYDPVAQYVDPDSGITVSGKLQIEGLLNDKRIGDDTLTASPPAVYALEPNILTGAERDALLSLSDETAWTDAVNSLYARTRNPTGLLDGAGDVDTQRYLVGLQPEVQRDPVTGLPLQVPIEEGSDVLTDASDPAVPEPARQFGPGLALIPNAGFLDPSGTISIPGSLPVPFPDVSWVTVAENNDSSMGGSPVTLHVIKVDRRERYRGAIQTILSDNVFDENISLRHTGDFGANADDLVFEWWYRPDDGSLNVLPPFVADPASAGPWQLFPDLTGQQGLGRFSVLLKGNPNAPETLLADSWWFVRYRHKNDRTQDTDWNVSQPNGDSHVNFEWAGAGNNDPFNDFDGNGYPDYRAQLAMGWLKRVLDAVNPYEARIRDFDGDNPATVSSMLQQLGPRYEGPVALNPDKDVIENVGLIELYETLLKRASDLSINLSSPVSTPTIANALQLVSTRLSDFYMLLGNEAYSDAEDPTIGFGSSSVEYGAMAPVVHAFQNQTSSLLDEELSLLRGVDNYFARPVYNRLFWNFTKGEGEAAYAMNYDVTDINADGFIDEDDAMALYPQGHGDAWGHYLTAVRKQYDLLRHPYFNWVSRSESYNLMDIVIPVDFLDERKFARTAAARAKAGAEIVTSTYREKYVEDPTAQWQGYTDVNADRAWGVEEWARRAGQGAYFDWVTANALLPSQHPNTTLEGIQKVDRQANSDIAVVSANLNGIQRTFDDANNGLTPLGLAANVVPFDINPAEVDDLFYSRTHFEQIYDRALAALRNAAAVWDYANQEQNRLRRVANTEAAFRNEVYQEDLSYRNRLVAIFGRPYDGTVGPGCMYPAGYDGPDLGLYMYVNVRELSSSTVPGPTAAFATFGADGAATGGKLYDLYNGEGGLSVTSIGSDLLQVFGPSFCKDASGNIPLLARDGYYDYSYYDLEHPKVPLDNLTQILPITAAGYTFQAPSAWGSRPVVGELQTLINKMMIQEATVANAIADWDSCVSALCNSLRIVNSKLSTSDKKTTANEAFVRVKYIVQNLLKGIKGAKEIISAAGSQVESTFEATAEFLPTTLPTAGLAISPGDALAPGRGAALTSKVVVKAGLSTGEIALKIAELVAEIGLDVAEQEKNLAVASWERQQEQRELLKSIEDSLGTELVKRILIFREIESLRALSDEYRSTIAQGAKLVDERAAYNKRVAALTQQNRYQDMTFRVSRNHALEQYHASMMLAARYAYLAAKAYDYETNLGTTDPGSPRDLFAEIVRAQTPGLLVNGEPQFGQDGLADVLARLKANYDALKGQLGFNNPQTETGKISLRTELYRILPSGSGTNSDVLWQQTLQNARVANLWEVPEYRYYAKPFASDIDADGNAAVEPGLVIRFKTEILAGRNVFGKPLSGGDQAYDPSLFATKVRSAGVWFSNYQTDDLMNDLPQAPRVYLFPVGCDIMSIANSPTPDKVRIWRIVDQQIPVPYAAVNSTLDQSNFRPLLDSLNGLMGAPRRYSSFRAYHDSGSTLDLSQMVFDSRLVGRSVWNTEWVLIIPGLTLNSDPEEGLDRFINQVKDIKLVFQTYGHSGM